MIFKKHYTNILMNLYFINFLLIFDQNLIINKNDSFITNIVNIDFFKLSCSMNS